MIRSRACARLRRMPSSASSVRQFSSQPPNCSNSSRRTNTVLPPSGVIPIRAKKCMDDLNQKKYSSTFKKQNHLVLWFMSCTPLCTASISSLSIEVLIILRISGCGSSSASKIVTTSPRATCNPRFKPCGLLTG